MATHVRWLAIISTHALFVTMIRIDIALINSTLNKYINEEKKERKQKRDNGGSRVNSIFHPSEADQMSTFVGLSGKK